MERKERKERRAARGQILDKTWELLRSIGRGSFAEVFHARNIFDGEHVAIKVSHGPDFPLVREKDVFEAVRGAKSENSHRFPLFKSYENKNDPHLEYIVMELLHGEDMSVVRDRSRREVNCQQPDDSSGDGSCPPLSLAGVAHLALEMLHCIRALHDVGFIHRDIKPANFVRRQGVLHTANALQFCLLDFGIAKRISKRRSSLAKKSNANNHSRGRERPVAGFRGTTMYASVSAHQQLPQGFKDDLWSMLFVVVDLIVGHLPWTAATINWHASKKKRKNSDDIEQVLKTGKGTTQNKKPRLDECNGGIEDSKVLSKRNGVKEDVLLLKKCFVEQGATSGEKTLSIDCKLTRWVIKELCNDVNGLEGSDTIRSLQHCLNTIIEHLQDLDVTTVPNYCLLVECFQGMLDVCTTRPCSYKIDVEGMDLLGLSWRSESAMSIKVISDQCDIVSADRPSFNSILWSHPVKVSRGDSIGKAAACPVDGECKGEIEVDMEEINTVKKSSHAKKAEHLACKVLQFRGSKLAQRVMTYSTRHSCSGDGKFQLNDNTSDDVLLELEELACEWYVLADACIGLCTGASASAVDWRVFQPLQTVLEKLSSFTDIALIVHRFGDQTSTTGIRDKRLCGEDCGVLQQRVTEFIELQKRNAHNNFNIVPFS